MPPSNVRGALPQNEDPVDDSAPDARVLLRTMVTAIEELRDAQQRLNVALQAKAETANATRLATDLLTEARVAAQATLARAERDALMIRRQALSAEFVAASAPSTPAPAKATPDAAAKISASLVALQRDQAVVRDELAVLQHEVEHLTRLSRQQVPVPDDATRSGWIERLLGRDDAP